MDIDEAVMIEQGYPAGCGRCKALREALESIYAIAAGWDEDGPTVPSHGISWESAGMLAVDLARAGLSQVQTEQCWCDELWGKCLKHSAPAKPEAAK